MNNWQSILKDSITAIDQLHESLVVDRDKLRTVTKTYPMRINPYYFELINKKGDPFWLQAIPDQQELEDTVCYEDPLDEENLSPVPNLVHKYPDRALFLVNSQCAMYCRFCTRKRKVGSDSMIITDSTIKTGLDYLQNTHEIRDVLISGGDPLLLQDDKLEWILAALRKINHIEIIRIGTRAPCTLPMRVTQKLAEILKKYHPLYINTHFNHPDEMTPEASLACQRLADAGIPLGCQTVLLRGVNDTPEIIKKLMHKLLINRVKPYYLFQGDMTRGTNHFRTPIETGLTIMEHLEGHTSGLAVPKFAVDLPYGCGKVRLHRNNVTNTPTTKEFINYKGKNCIYIDVE